MSQVPPRRSSSCCSAVVAGVIDAPPPATLDRPPTEQACDWRRVPEEDITDPMLDAADTIPDLWRPPKVDQRRARRRVVERHIRYRIERHRVSTIDTLTDISEGGAFVQTKRVVRPGTRIEGLIRSDIVGATRPIRFVGKVAWSSQYDKPDAGQGPGFGICFIRLAKRDRDVLRMLIETAPNRRSRRRLAIRHRRAT